MRLAGDPALRKRIGARGRERRRAALAVEAGGPGRSSSGSTRSPRRRASSSRRPGVRGASSRLPLSSRHVSWEGDFYAHHSLAVVNRALAGRLAGGGSSSVTPLSREAPPFAPDTALEVERIVRSLPPPVAPNQADVVVRHRWPPDLSSSRIVALRADPTLGVRRHPLGLDPPDPAPRRARSGARRTWVKECYVRSGVPESEGRRRPLGVDTDRFTPDGAGVSAGHDQVEQAALRRRDHPAQGIDVLLRSYLETFSADDDVCLVVKAFGSGHVYAGSTIDDQSAPWPKIRIRPRSS